MKKERDISEEFTTLNNQVVADNDLKSYIVNYVGDKTNPEDEQVTVGMIIDILAKEFPELVLCVSEENWVRGYQQALTDVEEGEKLFNEGISKV
jgi:hypothetical protein